MWPSQLGLIEQTWPTVAENVAADDVLLSGVQSGECPPVLRVWHAPETAVAIGRSQSLDREVHRDRCVARNVPIVRRSSGGGSVVLSPGCSAFSLLVPISPLMRQAGIAETTRALNQRIAQCLSTQFPDIAVQGTGDLTWQGRKFSGSAQRWSRDWLLHHGTWLRDCDLSLISDLLKHPSREPDYRAARPHSAFVCNVPLSALQFRDLLRQVWNAEPMEFPQALTPRVAELTTLKYANVDWTEQR